MKKLINILSLLLVLQLTSSGILLAQSTDRVFSDFRKLEIYMMKVWEIVKQFDDKKAVEYMALAKNEIDQARNFLTADRPQVARALIHMAKAKQYTDIAARLVLSKPFLNLKSQLDDLINNAEIAVSTSNSDEARYLLSQAKKFRILAYNAFQSYQVGKGEEYYRIAFFFAKKCMDFINNSRVDLSGQYEDLVLSVRQLLNQADELVMKQDQKILTGLVREAENHFEEANTLASEGKIQMAINRLQLIKRLLYRIFDQAENGLLTDSQQLENHLYTLRSLLESMDQEVKTGGRQQAATLLENAWNYFRSAEKAFENVNYTQCTNYLSVSQRFANKVFKMTKSRQMPGEDVLAGQIQDTRNLLALQESQVRQSANNNITTLHEEAVKMLNRAQDVLNNGQNQVAYQFIQAATRMSARLQREIRQESLQPERTAIERKYQQVINALINLEANQENDTKTKKVLEQIKRFTDEAKKYLDQGNNILAEEYVNTAWEQINQLTDKLRN
jgi:hypothetical protein